MTRVSCNCIVCAVEFNPDELKNIVLSKINITPFKVCEACINSSDPVNDYREVKKIVNSYLKFSQAKQLFEEVEDILESIKK